MKTHWLYGEGPNKELHFKVEVDVETDCSTCLHREVCDTDVKNRCSNFEFSCSNENGCCRCIHHFTRFDKDRVPCFHCQWHLTMETISKQLKEEKELP